MTSVREADLEGALDAQDEGMSFSARDVLQAVPMNSRSAINPAMALSPKTAQKRDRRALR
jgi:hypothetical protein